MLQGAGKFTKASYFNFSYLHLVILLGFPY